MATATGFSPWIVNLWDAETGKQLFEKEIGGSMASPPIPGMRRASNIAIAHVDSQRIAVVLTTPDSSFGPTRSRRSSFPARPAVPEATARLRVFRTDTGEESLSRDAEFFADDNDPFVFSRDGSCFATPLKDPFVQVCSTDTGAE